MGWGGGEILGRDVREWFHRETTRQRHIGRKGDPEHGASLSGLVSPTRGNTGGKWVTLTK